MTNELLEEHFKTLFYDLGERHFDVLKPEAWHLYVNRKKEFNEVQLTTLREWAEAFIGEYEPEDKLELHTNKDVKAAQLDLIKHIAANPQDIKGIQIRTGILCKRTLKADL